MIVVDTSVLAYAVGSQHELREPSRRLFEAVADGRVEATTTVEVIQELVHVRARRTNRREAAAVGRNYAMLLEPLLEVAPGVLEHGLALFERHPRLGCFDAVLAAAALGADADAFVSADRAFSSVPRLSYVEPGTDDFERLLAP